MSDQGEDAATPRTELVEVPGGYEERPKQPIRNKVVSFRLTNHEYANLVAFFETFENTGDSMRWLLRQPEAQGVIAGRVSASVMPAGK